MEHLHSDRSRVLQPSAKTSYSEQLIRTFVHPPGKVCLLYGDELIFSFSLRIAAHTMAQGTPLAVVDGCNRFNVHALARFAQEHRLDPNEFLNRIFISRGFTCYQMEQAIGNRLPLFLKSIGSHTAIIFGLLDTFYDEQVSAREAEQILKRLLNRMQELKTEGFSILIAGIAWNVLEQQRRQLFAILKHNVDRAYHVRFDSRNTPQLVVEQGGYHGTHRTDLHEHHRERAGELVEIPPRLTQRRPRPVR
jgi:hypothetical protein